jgi:putative hemolysin|nr:GNAT family N-acyltransferase [Nitrobacter hamburgensis]
MSQVIPALRAYSGLQVVGREALLDQEVLGRINSLEIRLATKAKHVRLAQKLRYRVFYDEMSATPNPVAYLSKRDIDPYDGICDHLIVIDRSLPANGRSRFGVVGTYRLLRQSVAAAHGGFYAAREYDIGGLLSRHEGLRFLELGRSCVLPAYRDRRTVELLWHGIWTYVVRHRIDAMIGCASFEGTNADQLALPLSFLHHHAVAPDAWAVRARPSRYVEMNRMAKSMIDTKVAMRALPPLIKGYLRVGAFIGHGAVIDRQFGTTDVFIGLPVASINRRYIEHFGPAAERHAA